MTLHASCAVQQSSIVPRRSPRLPLQGRREPGRIPRVTPTLLMTDPSHYDVSYTINPWMRPDAWHDDPAGNKRRAEAASAALALALQEAGATVVTVPGVAGLPDMVFPANAAIVLDGRCLVARFHCSERAGEAAYFLAAFEDLRVRGLIAEVAELPDGIEQEGAGDCIWDVTRAQFWVGWGQRSSEASIEAIRRFFGRPLVALQLASPRFYHLDTCFCVLPRGEVLFYPPAFTAESLAAIHANVPAEMRIEATEEDAARFCVNAVALGDTVVMANAAPALRERLAARGYAVRDVELDPFIMSGGGAYCMTLRLDLRSI